MEFISWNQEKNEWLKKHRHICFEDIVLRIYSGNILALTDHPKPEKYPDQMILIVNVDGYAYFVPFVFEKEKIFLKTIIPSRKYTNKYLKGE